MTKTAELINETTLPPTFPVIHLHLQTETASENSYGEWTTQYVTDDVCERVEDYASHADDAEGEKRLRTSMLKKIALAAEDFFSVLHGEQTDSFNGIAYGTTMNPEGIGNFVDAAHGITFRQLLNGVRFEGGQVSVRFSDLWEELAQQGLVDDDDSFGAVEDAADRYVLQSDATFKLVD